MCQIVCIWGTWNGGRTTHRNQLVWRGATQTRDGAVVLCKKVQWLPAFLEKVKIEQIRGKGTNEAVQKTKLCLLVSCAIDHSENIWKQVVSKMVFSPSRIELGLFVCHHCEMCRALSRE
jgi:hypothetical protein